MLEGTLSFTGNVLSARKLAAEISVKYEEKIISKYDLYILVQAKHK